MLSKYIYEYFFFFFILNVLNVNRVMKSGYVEKFELKRWKEGYPYFDFSIKCSQTCDISVLVHELGQKLKCGALLSDNRSLSLGDFKVNKLFFIK